MLASQVGAAVTDTAFTDTVLVPADQMGAVTCLAWVLDGSNRLFVTRGASIRYN